jgi:hypothetical protein
VHRQASPVRLDDRPADRQALMDYVCETYGLHAELDCVLFMKDTEQTWGTSWLYRN